MIRLWTSGSIEDKYFQYSYVYRQFFQWLHQPAVYCDSPAYSVCWQTGYNSVTAAVSMFRSFCNSGIIEGHWQKTVVYYEEIDVCQRLLNSWQVDWGGGGSQETVATIWTGKRCKQSPLHRVPVYCCAGLALRSRH